MNMNVFLACIYCSCGKMVGKYAVFLMSKTDIKLVIAEKLFENKMN